MNRDDLLYSGFPLIIREPDERSSAADGAQPPPGADLGEGGGDGGNDDVLVDLGDEAGAFSEEELSALRTTRGVPEPEEQVRARQDPGRHQDRVDPRAPRQQPSVPQVNPDGTPVDQSQQQPGQVPLQALHEAREQIRVLREQTANLPQVMQELEELRTFRQQLTDRVNQAREEAERAAIPDANEDPVAAAAWTQEQLLKMQQDRRDEAARQQEQTAEQQRQQEAARQQEITNQQTVDAADVVLDQAIAADPSVAEAYTFAAEKIGESLFAKGLRGEQLQQAFRGAVVAYATKAPKDPAQMAAYAKSVARFWGWYDPSLQPGEQKPGQQPGPQTSAANQQIDAIAARNAAAQTLSGGGQTGNGEITIEEAAALPAAELEALLANDKVSKRLLGS